jgi:hypothetical protein
VTMNMPATIAAIERWASMLSPRGRFYVGPASSLSTEAALRAVAGRAQGINRPRRARDTASCRVFVPSFAAALRR